jgi:hypothetical protein
VEWIHLAQHTIQWRYIYCKCGNEPLGSIQAEEFDQLTDDVQCNSLVFK